MKIYIHKDGRQQGPLFLDQINAKALRGELAPSDPAWIEGWPQWQVLSAVPGFVPGPVTPTPPAVPPLLNAVAARPKPETIFLYIPVARFVVMSILTMGLYEVYWIYRNWRYLNERDNLQIRPFWRGIFGIFFIKSLLTAIKKDKLANSIAPAPFSPRTLATGWIILVLVGNVLGRIPDDAVNILGAVVTIPTFLFLLPAQYYINRVNESLPSRPAYYRWSAGHIVVLVIGILAWIGTLFGHTQP